MMIQSFLQNHYDLRECENGYEFKTDKEVRYLITFIEYTVFENTSILTYSFNIERLSEPKNGQKDDKVMNTVLFVIYDFFQKNNDALITVCDSTDGKQKARKRLFDSWFNKYNDGSIIKTDGTFKIQNVDNYASLIFRADNKHCSELKEEFNLLQKENFYN